MKMFEKVCNTISKHGLLAVGDSVLVALSGGPDSVALLHLLNRLRDEMRLGISAVYINHQIRPRAARKEEQFCRKLCGKLGVELVVVRENIPALSKRMKKGLEETARDFRYNILEKLATRTEERVKKITKAAAKVLENAPWRGNVRELENILERALLMAETDSIGVDALPDSIGKAPRKIPEDISIKAPADFLPSMEIIEKAYIYWVLASTNWKKARAAEILGIDASTLYRKIEKYGLKEHIGD